MVALTSCRSVIFYTFNDIGFSGGISREEAKRKHQRNRNKNGKLFLRGSGSQVFFFKRLFQAKSERNPSYYTIAHLSLMAHIHYQVQSQSRCMIVERMIPGIVSSCQTREMCPVYQKLHFARYRRAAANEN